MVFTIEHTEILMSGVLNRSGEKADGPFNFLGLFNLVLGQLLIKKMNNLISVDGLVDFH